MNRLKIFLERDGIEYIEMLFETTDGIDSLEFVSGIMLCNTLTVNI